MIDCWGVICIFMTKKTPQQFEHIEERRCSKCNQIKNRKKFQKDSYDKYGLQAKCKSCFSIRNKEYNLSHKEYFKLKGKERYKKEENPARYARYRESYIKRRHEYSTSVRGRCFDLLGSAKIRAKKNKLEFDLDIDWLLDLHDTQKGKCILTDLLLDFSFTQGKGRGYNPMSPSLDKINPKLGYVKNNVRLVCTAINIALNSFGEDHFEKIAKAFLENRSII